MKKIFFILVIGVFISSYAVKNSRIRQDPTPEELSNSKRNSLLRAVLMQLIQQNYWSLEYTNVQHGSGCYTHCLCGFKSNDQETLKHHILTMHRELQKDGKFVYICPFGCVSQSKGPWVFMDHCTMHTQEKPFKCNICKGIFTKKAHLERHIKNIHQA